MLSYGQYTSRTFGELTRIGLLVRLFSYYLSRMNTGIEGRESIRKAFEYTVNHIGHDKDSGNIWSDYIKFLQQEKVRTSNIAVILYESAPLRL